MRYDDPIVSTIFRHQINNIIKLGIMLLIYRHNLIQVLRVTHMDIT